MSRGSNLRSGYVRIIRRQGEGVVRIRSQRCCASTACSWCSMPSTLPWTRWPRPAGWGDLQGSGARERVILTRTMSAEGGLRLNPTRRTDGRRRQHHRRRGMMGVSLDDVRGYMGVDRETAARIRERGRSWCNCARVPGSGFHPAIECTPELMRWTWRCGPFTRSTASSAAFPCLSASASCGLRPSGGRTALSPRRRGPWTVPVGPTVAAHCTPPDVRASPRRPVRLGPRRAAPLPPERPREMIHWPASLQGPPSPYGDRLVLQV